MLTPRERPEPFAVGVSRLKHRWTVPFFAFDWVWEWVAYFLSHWNFLEVLDYLGSFSVLIAVLFYFSESGDRIKQKHYQAWQVINTAQGKGGSGGRLDALQELNADHVPLVGVDASGAFLQGIGLQDAKLLRSNFNSADMREGDFRGADFTDAELSSANFRDGQLQNAQFHGARLDGGDFTDANLTAADLAGATLDDADLHSADLKDISWQDISSIKGANVRDVVNAPNGFLEWALAHGALTSAAPQK
ncbi:MAG: pentapeptide repeat-containing protein [Candidatus Acidiferrales bacterium]